MCGPALPRRSTAGFWRRRISIRLFTRFLLVPFAPIVTVPNLLPVTLRDPYAALRHGAYRKFLIGRGVFVIGTQMQTAAVGWQIYERLGSMLALGYVGLVQIVP